jgi:hypothetical protein
LVDLICAFALHAFRILLGRSVSSDAPTARTIRA